MNNENPLAQITYLLKKSIKLFVAMNFLLWMSASFAIPWGVRTTMSFTEAKKALETTDLSIYIKELTGFSIDTPSEGNPALLPLLLIPTHGNVQINYLIPEIQDSKVLIVGGEGILAPATGGKIATLSLTGEMTDYRGDVFKTKKTEVVQLHTWNAVIFAGCCGVNSIFGFANCTATEANADASGIVEDLNTTLQALRDPSHPFHVFIRNCKEQATATTDDRKYLGAAKARALRRMKENGFTHVQRTTNTPPPLKITVNRANGSPYELGNVGTQREWDPDHSLHFIQDPDAVASAAGTPPPSSPSSSSTPSGTPSPALGVTPPSSSPPVPAHVRSPSSAATTGPAGTGGCATPIAWPRGIATLPNKNEHLRTLISSIAGNLTKTAVLEYLYTNNTRETEYNNPFKIGMNLHVKYSALLTLFHCHKNVLTLPRPNRTAALPIINGSHYLNADEKKALKNGNLYKALIQ